MNLEIRTLNVPEELDAIRARWDALTDRSVYPNCFLRADWLLAWWNWFGRKLGRFHCLTVYEDSELVAGLPLFRTCGGTLKMIGYDGLTCPEYLGLVVTPERIDAVVQALAEYFQARSDWRELFFEDYALEDPGTARLVEKLAGDFPHRFFPGEGRYYIPLPDDFETYLATKKPNNRYKKRKDYRRAVEEHGARLVEPEVEKIDEWFPVLQHLARRGIGHKANPAICQANFAGMLRELLQRLMPTGGMRVFLLYYGETPASYKIGFCYKGRFSDYLTGFEPDLPYRTGNNVVQFIMRKLIGEGYGEFDFLRGLEDYKTHWTEHLRETQSVAVFRRRGVAYYRTKIVEDVLRPLWRRLKSLKSRPENADTPEE